MKKFLAILVLGLLLITNYSEAKTKDIGSGLTINIPKKYHYYEIDFAKLKSIFPQIEDALNKDQSTKDELEKFGIGPKTKLIVIPDNMKPVSALKKIISPNGIEKLFKDIEPYAEKIYKKYVKKHGYNKWDSLSAEEHEKILEPAYLDLWEKKYKGNKYMLIFLSDKKLDEEYIGGLNDFTEEYEQELETKGEATLKEELFEVMEEWQDDENLEFFYNARFEFTDLEMGKNRYDEYYISVATTGNIPGGLRKALVTTINNKIFVAVIYCIKKCNDINEIFSDVLKPINLFSKKIENQIKTTSSSLADELKKLNKLYKEGVLTKEEFEKAKKKLLN